MTLRALVARCISAGPAGLLKKLGFVRNGLVFHRAVGEVRNVAEVQIWELRPGCDPRVVVNLGAFHPQVHRVMGEPPLEHELSAGWCTVQERINRGPSSHDGWWKVRPGTERTVGERIAAKLTQRLEPWFQTANDLAALSEATLHGEHDFCVNDSLAPAAMDFVLGNLERGRARLKAELATIQACRRHRLESFRRHDPHGLGVLAKAHFMSTGKHTTRFDFDEFAWRQLR